MEMKVADQLGMPSIAPPMGPFPLHDECGIVGPKTLCRQCPAWILLEGAIHCHKHHSSRSRRTRKFNWSSPTQQDMGDESAYPEILVFWIMKAKKTPKDDDSFQ
jgi:hypothetical protein